LGTMTPENYRILVAPLACCEARLNHVRMPCVCVCVSLCVENFFPTNPYIQLAGLTDLDEIWHDGRS